MGVYARSLVGSIQAQKREQGREKRFSYRQDAVRFVGVEFGSERLEGSCRSAGSAAAGDVRRCGCLAGASLGWPCFGTLGQRGRGLAQEYLLVVSAISMRTYTASMCYIKLRVLYLVF